jgi:peptide chain release factor
MEKIIQITSGKGPLECQFVVAKVLKVFLEEVKNEHLNYEILHREEGDENLTLKSVSILIKGKTVHNFVNSWLGSVLWKGKSTFRKLHKRSNWFIGVFEIENIKKLDFNENLIQFQTTRSQGSGGQNVNKVSTAVRATYLPTGDSVFVQDSRSQFQNKKLAIDRLREKVMATELNKVILHVQETWNNTLQVQRGNPIRIFEGSDFKSSKQVKSFKKERNQLKKELKNELN